MNLNPLNIAFFVDICWKFLGKITLLGFYKLEICGVIFDPFPVKRDWPKVYKNIFRYFVAYSRTNPPT